MISMLIDHIGIIKGIQIFRIIGRLSMPIYAFFLVYGLDKTRNIKAYKKRLFVLAIISQFTYSGVFYAETRYINICATWYLCAVFMDSLVVCKDNDCIGFGWAVLSAVCMTLLPCEGGLLCLLWCIMWYFLVCKDIRVSLWMVLPISVYSISMGDYIQLCSVAAVPVVLLAYKYKLLYLPKKYKYIWRGFYPVHLGVLKCLH